MDDDCPACWVHRALWDTLDTLGPLEVEFSVDIPLCQGLLNAWRFAFTYLDDAPDEVIGMYDRWLGPLEFQPSRAHQAENWRRRLEVATNLRNLTCPAGTWRAASRLPDGGDHQPSRTRLCQRLDGSASREGW